MLLLLELGWGLTTVFHRFYGYIFCKPLEDNTPLVEIVYEFNGLVRLKVSMIPTTVSIDLFIFFLIFLEDGQKIGMRVFNRSIIMYFINTYFMFIFVILLLN